MSNWLKTHAPWFPWRETKSTRAAYFLKKCLVFSHKSPIFPQKIHVFLAWSPFWHSEPFVANRSYQLCCLTARLSSGNIRLFCGNIRLWCRNMKLLLTWSAFWENEGVWVQAGSSCCEEQQHQHTHKQPLIFLNFRPLGWLLQRATAQTHTHTNNDLYSWIRALGQAVANCWAKPLHFDSQSILTSQFYRDFTKSIWKATDFWDFFFLVCEQSCGVGDHTSVAAQKVDIL